MMRFYLKSLNACQMRKQKILEYRAFLEANGHSLVTRPEDADYILVWTCAFRADHRDASMEKIQSYRDSFDARLIVTGCLPDIAPEMLEPQKSKLLIVNWKNDAALLDKILLPNQSAQLFRSLMVEERRCSDADKYRKEHADEPVTFHDQFIKVVVSEGCNFNCSYCSERNAFPKYRSFTPDEIRQGVGNVIERTGVYDIILLADSLGQYGCDVGSNLPELISALVSININVRIALNNLHPASFMEYFDEMAQFIQQGSIRHINLPIQSASTRILKKMNRTYTREDIAAIHEFFRRIGFTLFDTHIIAGFPGETDEDFAETLDFIIDFKPRYVLASKYMESASSESRALSPKVPDKAIIERLERLESSCKESGIICNSDGNDLSRDRMRRLHRD
jgi:threonylcarbamoyladenosine tRNA methylthiotransferase CDKAL1